MCDRWRDRLRALVGLQRDVWFSRGFGRVQSGAGLLHHPLRLPGADDLPGGDGRNGQALRVPESRQGFGCGDDAGVR